MYKHFGKRLVDIIIGLFALPVVFLFLIKFLFSNVGLFYRKN